LDKIVTSGKGIVVMGDNINILETGSDYKQLLDMASVCCLSITIKEATRATDSSATEIVQTMTNLPGYQYKVGVKHSVLSDHYVQEMDVFMNIRTGISYKEVRDVLDDNIMELCTLLKNVVWDDIIGETDVNKIPNKLCATFN
jgi:deoxyribose-phosphate aldolase